MSRLNSRASVSAGCSAALWNLYCPASGTYLRRAPVPAMTRARPRSIKAPQAPADPRLYAACSKVKDTDAKPARQWTLIILALSPGATLFTAYSDEEVRTAAKARSPDAAAASIR